MSFAITGIPSSFRVPITAAEIIMGQGASNAPLGARDTIYIASMLSAGATATANTIYEIDDEGEAATLFGHGSAGHRCVRMHIKANKNGKLYVMPYAATSGGTPAAATATLTITGTATGTGRFIVSVCGELIEVGYQTGGTPTTIGDDLEAKINALRHLPVTASNSTGTVTITAKINGTSQNAVHRIRVHQQGTAGTTTAVAASAATLGSGAEGTTTELTNFTAALAAMPAATHYFIACPVTVDTFVAALKAHVATKNEPNPGIFCKGMAVSTGALAATATIAIAQNSELVDLVWQRNSDHSPDELLANWVAIRQKRENVGLEGLVYNFDKYNGADWFIKKAPTQSDWPDLDDQNDAINDGISPIASTQTGSYLVFSATTRSKDSAGSLDDCRATESPRISAMHGLATQVKTNHALTFTNFRQQADPTLPDGTVDLNAIAELPPRVTVPYLFEKWFLNQLEAFFSAGVLQNQSEWEEATDTRIDPTNTGRMQVKTAGRTIDLHHQATFRFSETTP
jgi:phage tail sheath gpL-like